MTPNVIYTSAEFASIGNRFLDVHTRVIGQGACTRGGSERGTKTLSSRGADFGVRPNV